MIINYSYTPLEWLEDNGFEVNVSHNPNRYSIIYDGDYYIGADIGRGEDGNFYLMYLFQNIGNEPERIVKKLYDLDDIQLYDTEFTYNGTNKKEVIDKTKEKFLNHD